MVNHSKTIESIKSIENIMKAIKGKQDTMHSRIAEWGRDTMYSPEYRDSKVAAEKEAFEVYAAQYADQMYDHCTAILENEQTLRDQSALDVTDNTFANILSIVNGLGASMPFDQAQKLAYSLRGSYPEEKCLAELYNKNKIGYTVQLTDPDQLCRNLRNYVAVFTSDKDKRASAYRGVEKACNAILEAYQSEHRVDTGTSELAFMEKLTAAAGLSFTN